MNLRDAAQELIELGPRGTIFRLQWEARTRTTVAVRESALGAESPAAAEWTDRLRLEDPVTVGRALRDRIGTERLDRLLAQADAATRGRVFSFGNRYIDYGKPIDWHRNPTTGKRWTGTAPWSRALADDTPGDVKHIWEIARFPHAYHMARAAVFFPSASERLAAALVADIEGFVDGNPVGRGVHWASGQETGFRLLAWIFAADVLLSRTRAGRDAQALIARAMVVGARHVESYLDYARIAVYNNHLLSEALVLFGVGVLLPSTKESRRWRDTGRRILEQESERQFYQDGGYIQQSHNYHRVALQNYLWACSFARSLGDRPSPAWLQAIDRSLELLFAHQNDGDGRLPNYGANDGALPSVLATCDFSDFRPWLQAASVVARGERLYPPGPWDEPTAWLLGVKALDAPLRRRRRTSAQFTHSGHHVLRGSAGSFVTFRCGTLRDRFSQIDMLHVDVWWRGHNVLADPGSFQYNAAPEWHAHFMSTAAHNTVVVDGRDQMVHHRQFKVLYWTKAVTTAFADHEDWAYVAGEHHGFRRYPGRVTHHRAVLFLKDDVWVVVDRLHGAGEHSARVHWLGGEVPWTAAQTGNGFDMTTGDGVFRVRTFASDGNMLVGDVRAGDPTSPRGWLSRYYGDRVAVPSFASSVYGTAPVTIVSILAGTAYEVRTSGAAWTLAYGGREASFVVAETGHLRDVIITK